MPWLRIPWLRIPWLILPILTFGNHAATTHGTLPWKGQHRRRAVYWRYSPANLAFAGGRHSWDRDIRSGRAWPDSWYDGLNDAQRAVLEPPYNVRLDRPVLDDSTGELTEASREAICIRGWDGIGRNPPRDEAQAVEGRPKL